MKLVASFSGALDTCNIPRFTVHVGRIAIFQMMHAYYNSLSL